MTDKPSWFAKPHDEAPSAPGPAPRTVDEHSWEDRFRGAVLGGAVGDVLGAPVRNRATADIQQWFAARGVVDYLPVFGRRGAGTDLTQLSAFTLEALLRAKALNPDSAGWLPTQVVGTNHLRWLHTQGVPWSYAMSAHLNTHPEPQGWLLERPELFSTRNPTGAALRGLGELALAPRGSNGEPLRPPMGGASVSDPIVWAAPTMVWNSSEELVFAAGASIAGLLTEDSDVQGAAGLHCDVLAQLIRGTSLWDAVSASDHQRLGRAHYTTETPAGVRRMIHAAMFASAGGRRPGPAELDIEFDTDGKPGELGIALASVAATDSFASAVRMAVNQSADSCVTGALAGQIAGALYGPEAIPLHWVEELELGDVLETLCADATEAFAPPPVPKWAQRYAPEPKRAFAGPLQLPTAEGGDDDGRRPYAVVSERVHRNGELPPREALEPSPHDGDAAVLPPRGGEPAPWQREEYADVVSDFPEPEEAAVVAEHADREDAGREDAGRDDAARDDTGRDGADPSSTFTDYFGAAYEPPSHEVAAYETTHEGGAHEGPGYETSPYEASYDVPAHDTLSHEGPAYGGLGYDTAYELPSYAGATYETAAHQGPSREEEPEGEAEPARDELTYDEPEDIPGGRYEPADDPASDHPLPHYLDEESTEPEPVGWAHGSTGARPPAGGHAKVEGPGPVAPSLTERVLGCLLGGALGNALGADLEVASAEQISERFGPQGPRALSNLARLNEVGGSVSGDTQMTLFTAEGLLRGSTAERLVGATDPLPDVQLAYQRWLHTRGVAWQLAAGAFHGDHPVPDGWLVSVPGMFDPPFPDNTVFESLVRFGQGRPTGSVLRKINDSKGCGGLTRAAPAALYSSDPSEVFELAVRTAALTHGHPSGYLSAGALAVIVQQALMGRTLDDGVWLALQVLETWEGHEETSALLKAGVELAGQGMPAPQQIERTLGEGWVAEQALAIAVCAALVAEDDVELALRVSVHHSGDSDSTGAVCGNVLGALLGVEALPVDRLAELKLRDVVQQIALDCVAEFGSPEFGMGGDQDAGQPADEDWMTRYPVRADQTAGEASGQAVQPGQEGGAQPEPVGAAVAAEADGAAGSGGAEPAEVAAPDPGEVRAPKPAPRRINGVRGEG